MNIFDSRATVCFNSTGMQHGTHTASPSSRLAAPARAYFYFWRFT